MDKEKKGKGVNLLLHDIVNCIKHICGEHKYIFGVFCNMLGYIVYRKNIVFYVLRFALLYTAKFAHLLKKKWGERKSV